MSRVDGVKAPQHFKTPRPRLEEFHELAHAEHRLELEHVRVEGLEDLLRETDK